MADLPFRYGRYLKNYRGHDSSIFRLQAYFSDYAPWLSSPQKGVPGVLGKLVERLLLKCRRHCAGLPDNQQRQFGRKHHLVGGQIITVNNGHGSILGARLMRAPE